MLRDSANVLQVLGVFNLFRRSEELPEVVPMLRIDELAHQRVHVSSRIAGNHQLGAQLFGKAV